MRQLLRQTKKWGHYVSFPLMVQMCDWTLSVLKYYLKVCSWQREYFMTDFQRTMVRKRKNMSEYKFTFCCWKEFVLMLCSASSYFLFHGHVLSHAVIMPFSFSCKTRQRKSHLNHRMGWDGRIPRGSHGATSLLK